MKTIEENPTLSIEAHRSFPVFPYGSPKLSFFICGLGVIPAFYMNCCFFALIGPFKEILFSFGTILLLLPGFFCLHHFLRRFLSIPPYQEAFPARWFACYYYLGVIALVLLVAMLGLAAHLADSAGHSSASDVAERLAATLIFVIGIPIFLVSFIAGGVTIFYIAFFVLMATQGLLNVFRIRQLKELGYRNFTMRECLQFLKLARKNRLPLVPVDELLVIPGVENNGPSLIALLWHSQFGRIDKP